MTNVARDIKTVNVRQGLADVHRQTWKRLAEAGTWWDGAMRIAIASEVRNVGACALCKRRKAALSPYSVIGTHDSIEALPEYLVDVIHRIVSDPGRLSQSWMHGILADGLSDTEYVETVGVIVNVLAVDQCRRGIGLALLPLPGPIPGEPTGYRPEGAKSGPAWVPMLAPEDVSQAEADLYPDIPLVSYVLRALSLVPAETRAYNEIAHEQYTPAGTSWDLDCEVREITFAQLELIASKVSVLNGCFY